MNNNPVVFDNDTPEEVKSILQSYLHTDHRIRLFYGDKITGEDWQEENDTMGYIGKSTGIKPCLLLVNNARSLGGGAILTHCIVKITENGRILWEHPNYHSKKFEVKSSDLPEYAESVYQDNEVYARFKKSGQAAKFVEFMEGKRNSK